MNSKLNRQRTKHGNRHRDEVLPARTWRRLVSGAIFSLLLGIAAVRPAYSDDCNANGIPDDSELSQYVSMHSDRIEQTDNYVAQFTFRNIPSVVDDVILTVRTVRDVVGADYYGDVYANDIFIGRVFESVTDPEGTHLCFEKSESLSIDQGLWNSAHENGQTIVIRVNYVLHTLYCNAWTWFDLDLPISADCDGDGVLNECAIQDCNGDGINDRCQWVDSDGDGVHDVCDQCADFDDSLDDDGDGIPNACDDCDDLDPTTFCEGMTIEVIGTPGSGQSTWTFSGERGNVGWFGSVNTASVTLPPPPGAINVPLALFSEPVLTLSGPPIGIVPGGLSAPIRRVSIGYTNGYLHVSTHTGVGEEEDYISQQAKYTGNGIAHSADVDIDAFGFEGVYSGGGFHFIITKCSDLNDADSDGIPDDCDVCPTANDRLDCNFNGVPDCQEPLVIAYSERFVDSFFGGYCSGIPLTHSDWYMPPSSGGVTYTITADVVGLSEAGEYLEVYGNDVNLGRVFDEAYTDCFVTDTLTIDDATWNAMVAAGGGLVDFELRTGPTVGCDRCAGFPRPIEQEFNYMADYDLDGNGVSDLCPASCDATGADSDGDGVPDACDPCPSNIPDHHYIGENGCPYFVARADFDLDGDVDVVDISNFFACAMGPGVEVAAECERFDFESDGDLDLLEFLSLQDAFSGADEFAELEAIDAALPHYILVDDYVGKGANNATWDLANRHCELAFGTRLASIDSNLSAADQQARIDEMTALAATLGEVDTWIGLQYNDASQRFRWTNGQNLIPEGNSVTNWWGDGQTPTASDFAAGQDNYCVALWWVAGYKWLNIDCADARPDNNVQAWLCDAPEATFGSEDHLTPAILDVSITSDGSDTITVPAGATISFDVNGVVGSHGNSGLAGFAFDLSFDGGDLTPVQVPIGLESFASPQGFNNPQGFGGKVVNGDLIQVGGGQNTMNNTVGGGPTGPVDLGIGFTQTTLANGSLTAPAVAGTYTLTLSNLHATTINIGETGETAWKCEPAVSGTIVNLTINVCAAADADNDGICDDSDSCITANDDCANATPIGDGVVFGCTVGASNDGFASCGSSTFSPDVWYVYTAAYDGIATADTCGAGTNFDSVLSVHDGCGGTQIACDNDGCGFPSDSSRVTWDIVQGRQYLIRVAGWFGSTGQFELTTSSTAYPANDDCDGAIAISAGIYLGSTAEAKLDPTGPCNTQWVRDVWFAYTNDVGVDVEIVADLCSPDTTGDTVIAAYDACGGNEIACNDDAGVCVVNPQASSMNWVVPCGATHLIRVATHPTLNNDYALTIREFAVGPDADGDGVGDACDACPGFDDGIDTDGDGLADGCDNCPSDANPDQTDSEAPAPALVPVTAWAFDEESGTASIDSVAGHIATLNGAQFTSDAVRGTAIEFPEGGSTVNVPTTTDFDLTEQMTIALWVRPASWATNINRLVTRPSENYVFRLLGRRPQFYVKKGGTITASRTSATIGVDQWTHLAAVWDGTGDGLLRIYINGEEASSYQEQGTVSAPIDASGGGLNLGNPSTERFEGLMDEVAVFGKALTSAEIQSLVDSGFTGDGVGDACDVCYGNDASGDSDNDGVCDDVDACPGFDDSIDNDGDGIPDACDTPCGELQRGDLNGDGIVNVNDISAFSDVLIDSSSATDDQRCAADVNEDGNVDGNDIRPFMSLLLTS